MSSLPLSAFIITKNEADRIERPIRSLEGLAEEVIVVDSGSTDGTQEVANKLGAKVIFNEWKGYGPQKRFAEEQCSNDWIINLDADEELTPELAEEIRQMFGRGDPAFFAYRLPLYDLLPGEENLVKCAHVNKPIRLYNRSVVRFADSLVHDSVAIPEAGAGELANGGIHRSFRSLSHAIAKMNEYTGAQAEDMKKRGKRHSSLRLYVEFPIAFCKVYFLRKYVMRGRRGFVYAMVYAFSRFVRLAKGAE